MKFLKFLLAIPFAMLTGYLMWLLFYWLTPIVMNLSWGWLIAYIFMAGGLFAAFMGVVVNIISVANIFLVKNNVVAKVIEGAIWLFWGFCSVKLPWSNGVQDFAALQWILAISFTAVIAFSYFGICNSLFIKYEEAEEATA